MNMTPATIVMQQNLESMQLVAGVLADISDTIKPDCELKRQLAQLINELNLQSAVTNKAIEIELTTAGEAA